METKMQKNVSEKEIAQNKKNLIEQRKNEVKNAKNSIFENADFSNLENTISKIKVKESINDKKLMYKFEKENLSQKEAKRKRQQLRNKRNRYANNIILYFQQKKETELKKEVSEFKKFYLENYILNDFSILSISSNNRDKETTEILESMLKIIAFVKTN